MFGKIIAPALETEVLIRFSFFALGFFVCCFFLVARAWRKEDVSFFFANIK